MTTIFAMDTSQAQGWAIVGIAIMTLLTGISGLIMGFITFLRQGRTEKKVDAVAVQTDGALSGLQKELQISKDRGEQLKEALVASGTAIPPKTKQTAEIPDPAPVHVEEPLPVSVKQTPPT